jgi:hypothetical protein
MPIVVDEVVISVEVTGGKPAPGAEGPRNEGSAGGGVDSQAIIEECVERVLDAIERRRER